MVDCSIPQIAGLTVQNILFEPFPERLLIREAHPDFLHGFSQKKTQKQEAHLPHFRAEDVLPAYV